MVPFGLLFFHEAIRVHVIFFVSCDNGSCCAEWSWPAADTKLSLKGKIYLRRKYMKKSISVFVFVSMFVFAGGGACAEEASAPASSVWTDAGAPALSSLLPAGPKSAVKGVADLFSTDIDNFLSVTGYGNIPFNKLYLFLGGASVQGALTGGVATKIGGNYFAFYSSGSFFPKAGTDIVDKDDIADGVKYEERSFQWDNIYSILWGSPAIGGLRLDFAFDDSQANKNSIAKKGNTVTQNQPFITAIRWSGLKFGDFSLKPAVAFQWPDYTKTVADTVASGSDTEEEWKKAALDVKLEAGFRKVAASYELLMDFGETQEGAIGQKGVKSTSSGYAVHTIQLDYTATHDADEKIQFKARPRIKAELYAKADKKESENDGTSNDVDNGTQTAFRLTPTVDFGVSWKLLPKLTFYTGTSVRLLELTTYSSTEGDDDGTGEDANKSYLDGANLGNVNFAFELNPSPAFGIEFGVNNIVKLSSGDYKLDITTFSGTFAVKVKI
jgi:hypothetical protein